jgi:hypothetical protein
MKFKNYFGIIIFCISILLLFSIMWGAGIISFKNLFPKHELRIEDTDVLVDDIKVISQLFTTTYYTEIVVDSIKKTPGIFSNNTHQLVIVARGTSYIGTDLSSLDTTKIKVKKVGNSLECELTIPKAKIFNTVVNPSGFSIFIDNKNFSPEEVQSTKNKAVTLIEKSAIETGILEKSNQRTIKLFHDLLISMGFSKVTITIE